MRTVPFVKSGCTFRSIAITATGIFAENTAYPLNMIVKILASGRKHQDPAAQ